MFGVGLRLVKTSEIVGGERGGGGERGKLWGNCLSQWCEGNCWSVTISLDLWMGSLYTFSIYCALPKTDYLESQNAVCHMAVQALVIELSCARL